MSDIRVATLAARTVAVAEHKGPAKTIDETRRPVYRHMIQHELVGGPSILRFLEPPRGDRIVDALVVTHAGFEGDDALAVETLPEGEYAILDYEGPEEGLEEARARLRLWLQGRGHPRGPILQVHHMDPVEGTVEEQLQAHLGGGQP